MPSPDLSDREYAALAELRHQLRRFLAFSEAQARSVELEPRQHQVLLALRGLPRGTVPTVGALAERLLLRHHTVVELIDRLERRRLIKRTRAEDDRRQARIALTPRGLDTLRRLSIAHRNELKTVGPELVTSLRRVLRTGSRR
ncbi:MAG TPA: MarR family transcriptional regulator [Kofleriaceae bacterium]|nr:MarR family transcriptional regulator [Kofleriaceae bacterium]